MKITIAKSEKEFDCIAAWRIIGEILNKPESVIGLSTGRTTGNLHRLVGEIYSRYPFDVSSVTFFGTDGDLGKLIAVKILNGGSACRGYHVRTAEYLYLYFRFVVHIYIFSLHSI